jgi:D-aminoacyl-tRNA deacylase
VSFEATHHGPSELKVPVWFVEIGSSESCWTDKEAGEAVSEAIWASVNSPSTGKSAVAFGGGHYAPTHSKVCLEQDIAIGHIIPKYAINEVDEWMVRQILQKTYGGAEVGVIDWKGLPGPQRKRLLSTLNELGITDVIKV